MMDLPESPMIEDSFWKDIVGSIATFTTICQFLSGMFTVYKIVIKQGGTVGELSSVPFLMGSVGCLTWLIYGYLRGDSTIINCNIVGTMLNAFYVAVFVKFTIIKTLIYRQVSCALVFLSLFLLYVSNEVIGSDSSTLSAAKIASLTDNVGLLCIVLTILSCASPLVALKEVIRTKSTAVLPFPLILSMFLVCSLWTCYGVLAKDPIMQLTNFIGTCIALVQLGLFCIYSSSNLDYKKVHNHV